jgi:hypothetical protein
VVHIRTGGLACRDGDRPSGHGPSSAAVGVRHGTRSGGTGGDRETDTDFTRIESASISERTTEAHGTVVGIVVLNDTAAAIGAIA